MSRRALRTGALIALALLLPGPILAKSFAKQAGQAAAQERSAVTIFVDASFGNRTNGAASNLSDAHAAFAEHGYRLLDVEIYTENGDLVGFFVSYQRAAPSPHKEASR